MCKRCRLRVSTCPTCSGKFIDTQNTAMYPCKNREAGCKETFTAHDINNHQSDCLYESRECPFKKLSSVDCHWTGILSDIGGHVKSEHGRETISTQVKFTLTLQNISKTGLYQKALFIWDRLFYLIWILKNATLYFTVLHFEPQNDHTRYTYEFTIRGSKRNISVTEICHSYLKDQSEVLKLGGFLALGYTTVEKYLDDSKSLLCFIHIRGICATPIRFQDMTDYAAAGPVISNPLDCFPSRLSQSAFFPNPSTKFFSVIYFFSFYYLCGLSVRLFFFFLINCLTAQFT